MPKKHTCDSEEEFFRKMVQAHKPVPDIPPPAEAAAASEVPEWQEKFWKSLAEPSTSAETPKPKETGTRPKTSRRSSTRVTPPSDPEDELKLKALYDAPYETPKWLVNKLKREGKSYPQKDYICKAMPGGKVEIKRKGGVVMPFDIKTNEFGQQYLDNSERHNIWYALEKLNLKDPKIVEEVRKACSTKPEDKVEHMPDKSDSDKKSKKKSKK